MAETFKRNWFGGGATSSEGYKVFFNSHSSVEYRDASGILIVGAEGTAGGMALFPDQMSVRSGRPPLDDVAFREEVIRRIGRVARFVGFPVERPTGGGDDCDWTPA